MIAVVLFSVSFAALALRRTWRSTERHWALC